MPLGFSQQTKWLHRDKPQKHNQTGEFETGMMAALLGVAPAVVFGGVGTIAVALLQMKLFPALRDLKRLE